MSSIELKAAYLLNGSDRPKIEVALERLRRHFAPESIERVSAIETTGPDVVALCNATSLFGDRRLVVVDAVDGRRNADRRLTNGWKAADVKAVVEYLSAPAEGTVLALVGEELKADSELARGFKRHGEILQYDVPKRSLVPWIAQQFRDRGARAEADACQALLHIVGDDDLHALSREIDKISTWAGEEPIGEREVEILAAPRAATPVFTLTDAWARRDTAATLEASEEILESSDRPKRDTVPRLAASLGSHLALMRRLRRLQGEGLRPREAASRLHVHPYRAEKISRQAEEFSETELDNALVRLARLDHAIKGGSPLTPELELQHTLLDICRKP